MRRGVAALLGELPDSAISNRFAATGQLSLSDLEVVVREQSRALIGAHRSDCVRFVPEQGGGVGRPLTNVGQFDRACRGEQPVVSSEDCVGRTVEQISTQCDGHREQQWMAAAEQVNGAIGRDGRPRGKKYAEQLPVTLPLHQRDDASDGMDYEATVLSRGGAHQNAPSCPEIVMQAALYRAIE